MRFSVTFLLFGLLIFMVESCTRSPQSQPDNVLARVGNNYLTVQQAAENIPDFMVQDSIKALRQYQQEWVQQQLLLQEAKRLGLDQKPEVQRRLQKAREEVLREALKDYVITSKTGSMKVSDDEARSYYQAHKDQFALDEKFVKFRHMQTRTIKAARSAKQDLLDAVPWPEVAQKYALNPQRAVTDSEQYWPISMAAKNIDIMNRYLNIIGQSEISPIQRVNGVYQFVQLIDTRAKGEQPDLDWLMAQIKDWLIVNKRRRNFSSYTKNLYLKAKSNNEVTLFNVLPTKSNQKQTLTDTLESNSTDE